MTVFSQLIIKHELLFSSQKKGMISFCRFYNKYQIGVVTQLHYFRKPS